ncbi:MAG TPA: AAA family ATPase [Saprospiraceae bacterium]|nr:AAA family ATPase [Saprospiraceae bacterium]HMQ85091.1 AAA family ATPase [Saprospiraceae bacterium]
MAVTKLSIPTLVTTTSQGQKNDFFIRPLFFPMPFVGHWRYESALVQFKKEIRQYFKGFVLNKSNKDMLLWLLFRPALHYELLSCSFSLGRQYVNGLFGVASFELSGHTFLFFPAINNYMFIAEKGASMAIVVPKTLQKLLKDMRDSMGESFVVERYFSPKKEFVTYVNLNVNLGETDFQFDLPEENWFFAHLMSDTDFEGAVEIEKVGMELNRLYPDELKRGFYQDQLLQRLYPMVYERGNTPLAIVGVTGVGKHTLVHELVRRYESQFYQPKKGRSQSIWHVDPTRIIVGMSIVGMWQKRFESILSFIQNPDRGAKKSDKLLIDNAVALLRIGKSAQNNMTLSDVMRPYLEKRLFQLILIATPEEWKIVQEKDRRFSDLFQVIRLQEPDLKTTVQIILEQRKVLEAEANVTIGIQAIHQLLYIQRNYLSKQALPGSVIQMLRQLAIKHRNGYIDAPEVREEFKSLSGLEEQIFDASYQLSQQALQEHFNRELVGQPEAAQALTNMVHLIKAKLADRRKPFSSFLFIGPTGVGKTQAAKVLCQFLTGQDNQLIRFDMNEYVDEFSAARLIGDSFNPEGQLTGAVRYRPFGILLLDEIEKAHPKIHDLLLQLLDDGRLTDSLGRTVDFTNTILIMTSNVGAQKIGERVGYQADEADHKAIYMRAVELRFRPEFVNRIDQIVVFNSLELKHVLDIARLQMKELLQRDGFVRRTTILNISSEALEWVARRGFDARMGGRALKRQIEKDLTTLSAEQLIATGSEVPILFDILLVNNQLMPRVRPLDFVTPVEENWLPDLPDEAHGKHFYRRLLAELDALKKQLESHEQHPEGLPVSWVNSTGNGQPRLGWQYYQFKDKVEENREAVRNMMLGFRDKYFKIGPAIPIRLKPVNIIPRKEWTTKGIRENIKDRLFLAEGIKEISEAYRVSNPQFDSLNTEFLQHYLNVAFLKMQMPYVLRNQSEKIVLRIGSCINDMGQKEVTFLMDKYLELLAHLDLPHKALDNQTGIEMDFFGIRQLFQGEVGVHLFYKAHQNPIPVSVTFGEEELEALKVIRIYDSSDTITDLRTAFSNAANITPGEFKLLLYAGKGA